jgi:hypothetical protein
VRANNSRRRKTSRASSARSTKAATTDNRAYTEDETGRIDELRSELDAVDERMAAGLELATRSEEIDNGIEHLLGVIADRGTGEVVDTRSIGERFTEDEYRSSGPTPAPAATSSRRPRRRHRLPVRHRRPPPVPPPVAR